MVKRKPIDTGGLMRSLFLILLLMFLMLPHTLIWAEAIEEHIETFQIESVTARLPRLVSYCYFDSQEQAQGVVIRYNGKELEHATVRNYDPDADAADYYILLDVSGSVRADYFAQMKEAVLQFQQQLGAEERMTLITFGGSVKLIAQDCGAQDDIEEQVAALEANEKGTLLYEGLEKMAELSDREECAEHRKVAIVMTDGGDFARNSVSADEAGALLREKSIPLYAMLVQENQKGEKNPFIEKTGELVRSTGGAADIVSGENGAGVLLARKEALNSAYVVEGYAENNRLSHQSEDYTITTADGRSRSVQFAAMYAQADTQAPEALVSELSESELRVVFSERVLHAEEKQSYTLIRMPDQPVAVYTVRCEEIEGHTVAVLSFEEKLWKAEYELSFSAITDASQEENRLTDHYTFRVTNGVTPSFWDRFHVWILIGIAVLIITGLIVALILILRTNRRRATVTVEGKAVLEDNVDVRHHVKVERCAPEPGKRFVFRIKGAAEGSSELVTEIRGSIIVGRSEICEVYMDDPSLSRQHFAISEGTDGFYIEDLHTTNGTQVNGRRITAPAKLEKGDRITAGEMEMTVTW